MHAFARHDGKVYQGSRGEGGLDVEHDPHARLDKQWAFWRLSDLPPEHTAAPEFAMLRCAKCKLVRYVVRQVLAVP
jgi:hypothetical protein